MPCEEEDTCMPCEEEIHASRPWRRLPPPEIFLHLIPVARASESSLCRLARHL